ncbi:cell division protein ZapA [Thermaurantiacus tibetensis]|uniref:cell division protein ZapA n=1 Tax=Thermaurantiacus tibetensis TaxID=2759035 RepID=UPI00189063E8|nr:cell division protein ZapA [Thermaurantiacus tibetensis]
MADVLVEVGGRSYRLACRDGEERSLLAAARELDRRAKGLEQALGALTEARLLLMAGLQATGDLLESGAAGPEGAPHAEARLARLADGLEALAERLETLARLEHGPSRP